jgi:hypothetical protein
MRILAIEVRRNELNHQRVDIPPHELPVLAYVHGEAACILLGEIELEDRPELLDANSEYSRLAQKYGRDKANESLEPRVAAVYGNGMRGVQELQRAIDYGQREDLPTEAFALHVAEAAHDNPVNGRLQPMQKTQIQPLSHGSSGSEMGQNGVPRPQTREGRMAEDVVEIPQAMQNGRVEAQRGQTVKAKRKAASGAQ